MTRCPERYGCNKGRTLVGIQIPEEEDAGWYFNMFFGFNTGGCFFKNVLLVCFCVFDAQKSGMLLSFLCFYRLKIKKTVFCLRFYCFFVKFVLLIYCCV